MFQHSPSCASVTTETARSEDKKTGGKIIHLLSCPRHVKLFSNFASQKHWPVIVLLATTEIEVWGTLATMETRINVYSGDDIVFTIGVDTNSNQPIRLQLETRVEAA
jgi:hypothetical protein